MIEVDRTVPHTKEPKNVLSNSQWLALFPHFLVFCLDALGQSVLTLDTQILHRIISVYKKEERRRIIGWSGQVYLERLRPTASSIFTIICIAAHARCSRPQKTDNANRKKESTDCSRADRHVMHVTKGLVLTLWTKIIPIYCTIKAGYMHVVFCPRLFHVISMHVTKFCKTSWRNVSTSCGGRVYF